MPEAGILAFCNLLGGFSAVGLCLYDGGRGRGKFKHVGTSPRDRDFGVNRKHLQGVIRMPQFNSNDCAQQRAYVMLYDYIQFSSYLVGLPCRGSTLDNQSPHSFQGK